MRVQISSGNDVNNPGDEGYDNLNSWQKAKRRQGINFGFFEGVNVSRKRERTEKGRSSQGKDPLKCLHCPCSLTLFPF